MTRYVALLRGVNVSGRNQLAMADLRARLGELGHQDVVTYIQSGNVILTTRPTGEAALARAIEAEIHRAFRLDVTVLVRTGAQLRTISTANPFLKRGGDESALHVTFLTALPAAVNLRALSARPTGPDDCAVVGREVYLRCPNGYGKTKLNNTYLERVLGVGATTRNWKTLRKLRELVDQ